MMGSLEKLSHAELTNTPPNTAHARVAAIQHNLQLHVENHEQPSHRVPKTGVFYKLSLLTVTCHVLETVHLYSYWPLDHLVQKFGKCGARQRNRYYLENAHFVAFSRLVYNNTCFDPSVLW
jgi:hypothetical protein